MTLGFTPGRFYRGAKLTCINLLLHYRDGCKANCLYCGQARGVSGGAACKTLIRVEWPLRCLEEVIGRARALACGSASTGPFRFCVASITNPRAIGGEVEVVRRLHDSLHPPISALITPTIFPRGRMEELMEAGAEMIGIAVDCATPTLFELLRGRGAGGPHKWDVYMEGVRDAVGVAGDGRVGVHLIVGLGESEKEAVELIQAVHDMGAETHLFSFYPERGPLEGWRRPDLGQYRRVQLARYIIDMGYAEVGDLEFNDYGQITGFGVSQPILDRLVKGGEPFMTSGCPGCNRPYSNERPGEELRNFPFKPSPLDIARIRRQLISYRTPDNTLEYISRYLRSLS